MSHENEAYANLLCGHLTVIARRLRQIPVEQWDWAPAVTAPSPRQIAGHVLQWLTSDRQHIQEPDALKHALSPDPPSEPEAMCAALDMESARWRAVILSLTPEELAAPRLHFNDNDRTVRWFVCHMIDNTIYKSGQLATLFFAMGLDGTEPYLAPLPNPLYAELRSKTSGRERGSG